MKKLGEILKNEREKRNLSLHEVGLYLKINPKILNSIEEGDFSQAPARTFLRGFVRSYAKYLRLDEKEILTMFDEATASKPVVKEPSKDSAGESQPTPHLRIAPTTSVAESVPSEIKISSSGPMSRKNILALVIVVSLVVVIFSIQRMIEKYQKESVLDPAAVETESEALVPETTTTLSEVEENSSRIPTTTTEVAGMTLAPTTTSSTTTTSTTTTTTTTTTTVPKTTTTLPAVVAASNAVENSQLKPVEVIVEAQKSVKVSVSGGSTNSETFELNDGQIKIIKGKGRLQLEVQPGDGAKIFVNGVDRGKAGKTSNTVKLAIP